MIYLLHHYLDRTASRCPGKTAIQSGSETITFAVLSEKSNRLANQLAAAGHSPRHPVGIYLPKSIEAITAMFAILKAGGMYIPLDAYYSPLSRIKQIIRLSEMNFIITRTQYWNDLVSSLTRDENEIIRNMNIFLVDDMLNDDMPVIDKGKSTNGKKPILPINGSTTALHPVHTAFGRNEEAIQLHPYDHTLPGLLLAEHQVTDDDLAYILYTSGSTGIPKGVMLTHRNALTFVNWALSFFKPGHTDVFSNIAPLHFDLSVFDIFVSIACSGCIHLLPPEISNNPRAIASWIRENRITCFYSVPSVWISMMQYAHIVRGDMPSLKRILFAGEVFPPEQLKTLMGLLPHAGYFNLYGPTETNVCTYYQVKNREEITDTPVPIGSACANTEVLVLKEDDTQALPGEQGELLVKGSIVTKGYYKNPERTKKAFRKSPLPYHQGALFYKTGDIVRVITPGTYHFICRKDLMVKCSGFRVELQEVEQVLQKHTSIQEAIVVPVYDTAGVNVVSLSAFVTSHENRPAGIIELKKFMASLLPRYMIPETVLFIKEIPKNANGKADRQYLFECAKCGFEKFHYPDKLTSADDQNGECEHLEILQGFSPIVHQ